MISMFYAGQKQWLVKVEVAGCISEVSASFGLLGRETSFQILVTYVTYALMCLTNS